MDFVFKKGLGVFIHLLTTQRVVAEFFPYIKEFWQCSKMEICLRKADHGIRAYS